MGTLMLSKWMYCINISLWYFVCSEWFWPLPQVITSRCDPLLADVGWYDLIGRVAQIWSVIGQQLILNTNDYKRNDWFLFCLFLLLLGFCPVVLRYTHTLSLSLSLNVEKGFLICNVWFTSFIGKSVQEKSQAVLRGNILEKFRVSGSVQPAVWPHFGPHILFMEI